MQGLYQAIRVARVVLIKASLGFVSFHACFDAVLACPLSWTPSLLYRLCTKVKLRCTYAHDQFCRPCIITRSNHGLDSQYSNLQSIKGGSLHKKPSLNLIVFVARMVASVNINCIVTLICNDRNNACLECDRYVQTYHFTMETTPFLNNPLPALRSKGQVSRL